MQKIRELCILCFGFASIVLAIPTRTTNSSASLLDVIKPQDIGILRGFRGRALPERPTIWFLYRAQLELFRRTVRLGGDEDLSTYDVKTTDEYKLELEIRPFDGAKNTMTIGSSFFAIYFILQTELVPQQPEDGFWELEWTILNRAISPGHELPIGHVSLKMKNAQTLKNVTTSSLSAPPFDTILDLTSPSSTKSSAPFPVPDTYIVLLIGPRGADFSWKWYRMMLTLQQLITTAWHHVAAKHRVERVSAWTWNSPSGISVVLRPRMNGRTSLVTDIDLAEATYGLLTYFLSAQAAFATNITIVRPNEHGRRVPIGEIELRSQEPGTSIIGPSEGGISVGTA